jgi:hypothetical protein
MFVCCECCVFSGKSLCDELITCPQESYQLCCVVVCDLETLKNEEAMTSVGSQRHKKLSSEKVLAVTAHRPRNTQSLPRNVNTYLSKYSGY